MTDMGKRKRRADRNKTPLSPAFTSHTSHTESSFKEKSSHSCGSSGAKPASSSSLIERSSPVHHQSFTNQRQQNVNHTSLSRVPRHSYNVQHFHKNTANHAGTSTSHGKTPLRDDKHSWKFGHNHKSESGFGYFAGRKDKASRRMDRIRSNPLAVINAGYSDLINNLCRLCQQRMRENSVVAVLVCGHIYHADCLEIRTSNEDKRDPPCPLCIPLPIDN